MFICGQAKRARWKSVKQASNFSRQAILILLLHTLTIWFLNIKQLTKERSTISTENLQKYLTALIIYTHSEKVTVEHSGNLFACWH